MCPGRALEHPTLQARIFECPQRDQQLVLQTQIDLEPTASSLPHVVELVAGDGQGSGIHGCGKQAFDALVIDRDQQTLPRFLPERLRRERGRAGESEPRHRHDGFFPGQGRRLQAGIRSTAPAPAR
jgi:hypothetical protein